MTVNTTNITSGPYPGNGVTDTFSYTFRVENKNQLTVFETDDLGVETPLTVDTDYTVNTVGDDAGGTITRVAGALPTGYQWYIRSNYSETQLTAFSSQGAFFPRVHESAMDKLTFLIQQITDRLGRAIRFSDSYSGSADPTLPEPTALNYVRWNAAGTALENAAGTANGELIEFFDSVTDMIASPGLVINKRALVFGYYSNGDGGFNCYNIVAGGSGVADDGSRIDLDNGLQAEAVFPTGVYKPKQWGAVGDGVTDDTTAIQSMIDYVASLPGERHTIDLDSSIYGISAPLDVTALNSTTIQNGELSALAGTWGAGTAMINAEGVPGFMDLTLANLLIDANQLTSGIFIKDLFNAVIRDCDIFHFTEAGIRTRTKAGDLKLDNINCTEWQYADAGRADYSLRVAKGFDMQTADFKMIGCKASYCLYPLYIDNMFNAQLTNCHFFNGSATSNAPTNSINIYVASGANGLVLTNLYIDNGVLLFEDSFNHVLCGAFLHRNTDANNIVGIELRTSVANSTGAGLIVNACQFSNGLTTDLSLTTTGAGSWSDPAYTWLGNQTDTGVAAGNILQLRDRLSYDGATFKMIAPTIDIQNFVGDVATIQADRAIRLSADYNNNSGATQSILVFATDGSDRWKVNELGHWEPINDSVTNVGTGTNRPNRVFGNTLVIVDGITAPSTIAGHAAIYVDAADGDLKVKFGDGTVKTIATDT